MSSPTRTYRGRAIDELIPRIQQELGSDAIIVRRREGLTGGILGFFQHPYVEIEAMAGTPRIDLYDEAEPAPPYPSPPPPAPPPPRAAPPPPTALPPLSAPAAPRMAPAAPPAAAESAEPSFEAPPQRAQPRFLQGDPAEAQAGESAYVTAHLARLARAAPRTPPPERPREPPPGVAFEELIPRDVARAFSADPAQPAPRLPREPPPYAPPPRAPVAERRTVASGSHGRARAGVEKSLSRLGLSRELAGELIDSALAHVLPLAPRLGLAQAVRVTLAQRIPVAPPLPSKGAGIVVVGAGGAGKTTCCAALLGAYRMGSSLPASYATVTRGAGSGFYEMILSPHVMKPALAASPRVVKALRKARGQGVVVLDTPRLSPADRTGIRELGRLLGELEPERVIVALPATLGPVAAAQLLEALAPLGANALALTHADETDQIGVAIEAACSFALAPEYMLERGRSGGWRLSRIDPTGLAGKLLP